MSATQQTASQTAPQTDVLEVTFDEVYVKPCGRNAEAHKPNREGLEKVWPAQEGDRSTIGGSFTDAALRGTHMTFGFLTHKNNIAEVSAALALLVELILGKTAKLVAYSFFGPNTVVFLEMCDRGLEDKCRSLDSKCTPEGKGRGRIYHISLPVVPKKDNDGNIVQGVWEKRFPDVSDEKFERCVAILNHPNMKCFAGMTDDDILKEVSPHLFEWAQHTQHHKKR